MRRSKESRRGLSDAIPIQPTVERAAAQTERTGSTADVAFKLCHCFSDEERFHLLEAELFEARRRTPGTEAKGAGLDALILGEEDRPFNGMLQFTYVTRPVVFQHNPHGGSIEFAGGFAVLGGVVGEEEAGQGRDVFAPFAEWWQMDLNGVEAVEQVSAETSRTDFFAEFGVGGR